MNTPAARGAGQGSEMRIDAIDIYWARLPLAFNFRTSYGDPFENNTILVRMETEGQHGWGESRPPYFPANLAERTPATFQIVLSGWGEVATSKVPGIAHESDPDLLKQWTAADAAVRG